MYTLMLTPSERKAIDWVGNRYEHGYGLYCLLWNHTTTHTPEDADWDSEVNITFKIPEHVAWEIRDMGEEGNYLWDCFAPEFCEKLNAFCEKIV